MEAIESCLEAYKGLPRSNDFEYYRTYRSFREAMDSRGKRLHFLLTKVIESINSASEVPPFVPTSSIAESLDLDEASAAVSETSDVLFERLDHDLDDLKRSGFMAMATAVQPIAWNPTKSPRVRVPVQVTHAKNIERPQLKFPDPIDNNAAVPFMPKLRTKPNALVPLAESLGTSKTVAVSEATEVSQHDPSLASHIKALGISVSSDMEVQQYPHPYMAELSAFEPSSTQLCEQEVPAVVAFDKSPYSWISTKSELSALCATLEKVDIFAVDLEAHSFRTYSSFCCLMQISTATSDFLVDTLALRGELDVLNCAFTNPNIVKVLHGADSDILWLQKDLGLYMVNMFDTGQAARVLEFPKYSLAYLLSEYCDVTANKTFQLADWRIRPLTPEMVRYAREDTHYLLHIYARLVNELIVHGNTNCNLLKAVWMRSRDICLQRYEKSFYDSRSARVLFDKHSRSFSATQRQVFNALHAWRDSIARTEDESVMYVLPNHMLFELAEVMPREMSQVLACCKPVPPLIRISSHLVLEVIRDAKTAIDKRDGLRGTTGVLDVAPVDEAETRQAATAAETTRHYVPVTIESRSISPPLLLSGIESASTAIAALADIGLKWGVTKKAKDLFTSFANTPLCRWTTKDFVSSTEKPDETERPASMNVAVDISISPSKKVLNREEIEKCARKEEIVTLRTMKAKAGKRKVQHSFDRTGESTLPLKKKKKKKKLDLKH